jgi:hypothetical protein
MIIISNYYLSKNNKIMATEINIFGEEMEITKKRTRVRSNKNRTISSSPESNNIVFRTKLGLSKNHIKILKNCKQENTAKELMDILGFTNLTKFRRNYLNILLDEYKEAERDIDGKVLKQLKIDNSGKIVTKEITNEFDEVVKSEVYENKMTIKKGYGFFKMSKPDKPNAKDQKYIWTNKFIQLK